MLVNRSDLDAANSSANITNLTKDKEDAQAVMNAINDFNSSSKEVLVGDSFDAIRTQLNNYAILMQERINVADALLTAIKSANDSLANYMDGESKLDTDDYDDFKSIYDKALSDIDSLTARINGYDEDKETTSLESLKSSLATAEATAKKYKRLLDLLEGLPGADSSAYGTLSSGSAEADSFKSSVGEIVTIRY